MPFKLCVLITLLAVSPLWAQLATSGAEVAATGPSTGGNPMLTPAPISGEGYAMGFASETRANYLRGGLVFGGAYDDGVIASSNGQPVSDASYSLWPTISVDQTRSPFHWALSYSPGFTFYQKTNSRNEADQNFALDSKFRLSPHVTLSLRDSFQKASNVLNQPSSSLSQPVSGAVFAPNDSVIAPVANMLRNTANATLTYQFAANRMIGASGTFSNLHYPNQAQVPGLYDSSSRGGSAFYNYRLSKMHYVGATYQYQVFMAYPTVGQSETQAHSILVFYTLYIKPTFSISVFGGPQHSDTTQFGVPASRSWSPAAGASMGWQGRVTSFAASYSRTISDGGGLAGAVYANNANGALRRQLTRNWSASMGGSYASNIVLASSPMFNVSGHTISGNASVQRQFGEHLNLQLQYMRLHQSYSDIAALASAPNRNREAITISYQFARPLGR